MAEQRSTPRGSSRCEVVRCGTGRAIVFIAVALALVSMISAASAVSQTWNLSSNMSGVYIMYRVGQVEAATLNIDSGANATWRANECATTTVTFPAGNWSVNLTKGNAADRTFNASIGVWTGSAFIAYGNFSGGFVGKTTADFTISASGFTVPQGQWLAFLIINTGNQKIQNIATGIVSKVTSPPTSPAYPVPELATFVLFGVGLLALVGYIRYKKRT